MPLAIKCSLPDTSQIICLVKITYLRCQMAGQRSGDSKPCADRFAEKRIQHRNMVLRSRHRTARTCCPACRPAARSIPARSQDRAQGSAGISDLGSALPRASVGKLSAKCCSFSAVSAPIFCKKIRVLQHFSKSTR